MKAKAIFIKHFFGQKVIAGMMVISTIISALIAGIAYTEAVRQITQAVWNKNRGQLTVSLLFFGVIVFLNFGAIILRRICVFKVKKHITGEVEDIVYNHYAQYEYWGQPEKETALGTIWKIIPNAVELFTDQIVITGEAALVLVCGSVYGMYLNKGIMVTAVFITGIMVWVSRRVNNEVPDLYREYGERNGKLYNLLWEQVKNREISSFMNPDHVLAGYERESKDYLGVLLKIKKATNGAGLFSQFGSSILIVLVSLLGGWSVLEEQIDFSALLAMIILIQTIAAHFFMLPHLLQEWKKIKGYWNNIDEILDCKVYNGDTGLKLDENIFSINVRDVSFGYAEQKNKALCHINITFRNGMFYAIAGASGCGKSTLLRIIAKLLPGWTGEVLINSVSLEKIERGNYWGNLTLMEQVPVIYPGTLLRNITLEDTLDYDKAKLDMAVQDAALSGYIECLPYGLHTHIDENKVSKGEGVKINLARTFYNNTSVLLLDEITEGIDPESEREVLEALKRMAERGKMIICVSHKKELLEAAGQVIYMKEGAVINVTSHQYLIENDADYRELLGGGNEW